MEQREDSVEELISNLDPDYVDCPFGIRIHPDDCITYTKVENNGSIKGIVRHFKCIDCKDIRVDKTMERTFKNI